jgi:hypothetical protein
MRRNLLNILKTDTHSYTSLRKFLKRLSLCGYLRIILIFARGMGDQKCLKFLVGKSEGKRPLGRTIRIWKDNIKTDL